MGSKKIMAVDDEVKNLALLEAILLPLGYDVEKAKSGDEALAKIELMARVKNLLKVKEYNDSIKDWSHMLQDKVI